MLKGNARIEPQGQLQDDSWLNDLSASGSAEDTSGMRSLASQPTVYLNQKVPTLAQAKSLIGVGHPLWPIVLQLSERVWQDLFEKGTLVPTRTQAMTELVRTRTISLLQTDPLLSKPVHGMPQAELLLHSVVKEVLGYGPLDIFLQDRSLSKIMVVNPQLTYVERQGRVQEVNCCFEDEQHMQRIIGTMLRQAGRATEPFQPLIDLRLPDGTAVNIALPPNAVKGPTITITTRWKLRPGLHELILAGSLSQTMADFLVACVQARLNIVICGDQDSGRTSLLNALAVCIPDEERIVSLEDHAELLLSQRNHIALQPTPFANGNVSRVTMRDLVSGALRMRPDRILLDECRGEEALGMLQAIQTGYKGVIMNIYAENPRDCLARLELFCQMGASNLSPDLLRSQLSTVLDIIVYVSRFRDGSRKIRSIVGVQGAEGTMLRLQNIFHFYEETQDSTEGEVRGAFKHSGLRPKCLQKLAETDVRLPWN